MVFVSRYVQFNDDVRVALFNVRNLRNFGVIRSSVTDEALRLAPNFNNNQAYLANPSGDLLRGNAEFVHEASGQRGSGEPWAAD